MKKNIFWFKGAKYKILEGKDGIRKTYDGIADVYDCSVFLYWTRKMEEGEERIVKKWIECLLTPVLDVGCGTGRYAVKIARRGSEVVASDVSINMLKKTVEKARKHGCYKNIDVVLADGEHLPFRNKFFSGLVCALTFDHFENCELAAREFSRVMKKHGLIILSTFNRYTMADFKRRHNLPPDKIPFRTENMPPVLIYEVGHSSREVEKLFARYGFDVMDMKGCCYWHLLPSFLIKQYRRELDSLFNILNFLKYAEIHITLLKKN
jgi:ubiquinone/menaquinone biosynthesis C-methylase UbiE